MNVQVTKVPRKKLVDIRAIRRARAAAFAAIPEQRTIVEGKLRFSGDDLIFYADQGAHASLYIDGEWVDVEIEGSVTLDMSGSSNGLYYIFLERTTHGELSLYATALASADITRIDGVPTDTAQEWARAVGLVGIGTSGNRVLISDPNVFIGLDDPIKLAWGDMIEWIDTGGTDAVAYLQTYIEFFDDLMGLLIGIVGTNDGAYLALEARDGGDAIRAKIQLHTDGSTGDITLNANAADVDTIIKDDAGNEAVKVDAGTGETTVRDLAVTGHLKQEAGITLTITAGGAVTPENWYHALDTNGGAASDDLATINTTNAGNGDRVILQSINSLRNVVIKHGTGNIFTKSGADVTLDTVNDIIMLCYRSGTSKWYEV